AGACKPDHRGHGPRVSAGRPGAVLSAGEVCMKVQYERLFNLGNYENEKIIVEDEVRPGETPGETYTRLRAELFAMAGRADPRAPKPAPAPAPIFQPEPDDGHDF